MHCRTFSVLAAVAVCLIGRCTAQSPTASGSVCYQQGMAYERVTVYQIDRQRYNCGFFNWRRCQRTLYRVVSQIVSSRTVNFGCCEGYGLQGLNTCEPICNPVCHNGGTCNAPNMCTCAPGWTGSVCNNIIDIDECTSRSDNCEQMCINTFGSYTCSCNAGYTLSTNGYSCIDNNECIDGTSRCEEICRNTLGSYICDCNPGYEIATNGHSCQDIDECNTSNLCHQECSNTLGSYICSCLEGYNLASNGLVCIDNNECALLNTNRCQQQCFNTPGSYTCECNTGFTLNENYQSCDDNNECNSSTTNQCEQHCVNVQGSYLCDCSSGYHLSNDGFTCSDIDECLNGDSVCDHICTNTAGSYECTCYTGYILDDDGTCTDINECQEGTDSCSQNCVNTIGSYSCTCNSGFILDVDGHSCEDINECVANDHTCEQECNNTKGAHKCACFRGYELNSDGFSCIDIDECTRGTNECNQTCNNEIGSFHCSCSPGWTLSSDGTSCNDINECAHELIGNTTCSDRCINDPGGYHCDCSPGYILDRDMTSCNDINECLREVPPCEQGCRNSVGSFVCTCIQGFKLGNDTSSCIGPQTNVALRPTGSRTCTLSWNFLVTQSGTNVISYNIWCNSEQHLGYSFRTQTSAETEQQVLNRLLPHSQYNCCLNAVTTNGVGPTVCVHATTLDEAPQTPPTSVTAVPSSPYSLTVMWGIPAIPNGVIVVYFLYVTRENEQTNVYSIQGGTYSLMYMYSIDNLNPYELVRVSVSASTIAGEGPQFEVLNRTLETAPSKVIGITAASDSDSQRLTIRWDPPTYPNGELIYYRITVNHVLTDFSFNTISHAIDSRITTVTGLTPFVPYTVTLYAATNVGESIPSSLVVYTEHRVPAIPFISSVIRLTGQTATVTWVPLTPDETRGLLTNVWIVYESLQSESGICSNITKILNSSNVLNTTCTTEDLVEQSAVNISTLLPSNKYCIAMQVGTRAGQSGFSNTLELSLPPGVPFQTTFQVDDEGCQTFLSNQTEVIDKLYSVTSVLSSTLSTICGCRYSQDLIINRTFMCGCQNEVIFIAMLLSSDRFSVAEIIPLIHSGQLCTTTPIVLTFNEKSYEAMCLHTTVEKSQQSQCKAVTIGQETGLSNGPVGGIVVLTVTVTVTVLICAVTILLIAVTCIYVYRRNNRRNQPGHVDNNLQQLPANFPNAQGLQLIINNPQALAPDNQQAPLPAQVPPAPAPPETDQQAPIATNGPQVPPAFPINDQRALLPVNGLQGLPPRASRTLSTNPFDSGDTQVLSAATGAPVGTSENQNPFGDNFNDTFGPVQAAVAINPMYEPLETLERDQFQNIYLSANDDLTEDQ